MAGYIHSYRAEEQQRLVEQAEILAPFIQADVELEGCSEVLEIGCGVGAQLRLLRRRFPGARFTGIDIAEEQLLFARRLLKEDLESGKVVLKQASGAELPWTGERFDAAYLFFVLEHVPEPLPFFQEALRVLVPGGVFYATEVVNTGVSAYPQSPAITAYWQAFNTLQRSLGGDPDVGIRLGSLAVEAGFSSVEVRDVSPLVDRRMSSADRSRWLAYWERLFLSGADQLIEKEQANTELVEAMRHEFAQLRQCTEVSFLYSARQLRAYK